MSFSSFWKYRDTFSREFPLGHYALLIVQTPVPLIVPINPDRVSASGLIIRRLDSVAALHAGNRSSTIAADFFLSFGAAAFNCAFATTTLNNTRNYPCVKCNEQLEAVGPRDPRSCIRATLCNDQRSTIDLASTLWKCH